LIIIQYYSCSIPVPSVCHTLPKAGTFTQQEEEGGFAQKGRNQFGQNGEENGAKALFGQQVP
jgi:hypothetical protein